MEVPLRLFLINPEDPTAWAKAFVSSPEAFGHLTPEAFEDLATTSWQLLRQHRAAQDAPAGGGRVIPMRRPRALGGRHHSLPWPGPTPGDAA